MLQANYKECEIKTMFHIRDGVIVGISNSVHNTEHITNENEMWVVVNFEEPMQFMGMTTAAMHSEKEFMKQFNEIYKPETKSTKLKRKLRKLKADIDFLEDIDDPEVGPKKKEYEKLKNLYKESLANEK